MVRLGPLLFALLGCGRPAGTTVPPEVSVAMNPDDPDPAARPTAAFAWPRVATVAPELGRAVEPGRTHGDRSVALPDWDQRWFRLAPVPGRAQGQVHGTVAELRPAQGERTGALRITGDDGNPVELPLQGPGRPALAVGDEVAVRWHSRPIQIHWIDDVAVIDAQGRVVYASSGTGDASYAPGWHVAPHDVVERSPPHMRGGAQRESRWLLLAHGDAAALVQQSEGARRLTTAAGDYAVSGVAISWSEGMLPPDSSTYHSYTIVRLP